MMNHGIDVAGYHDSPLFPDSYPWEKATMSLSSEGTTAVFSVNRLEHLLVRDISENPLCQGSG